MYPDLGFTSDPARIQVFTCNKLPVPYSTVTFLFIVVFVPLFLYRYYPTTQCYGFGMIFSGSGSGYESLYFRIRTYPCYLSIFVIVERKPYNRVINKKEEICPLSAIFYFTLQFRIHRHKIRSTILFYMLLHSCRIVEKVPDPTGSGSTTLLLLSPF